MNEERIPFDDFAKLDLRVGTIVDAAVVEDADRLLALSVDIGEGVPRSIIAGIRPHIASVDDLVGRRCIIVANLEPRKLKGLTSDGMLLAAGDGEIFALLGVQGDVPNGTRVR